MYSESTHMYSEGTHMYSEGTRKCPTRARWIPSVPQAGALGADACTDERRRRGKVRPGSSIPASYLGYSEYP
jgi:hypothetical protein